MITSHDLLLCLDVSDDKRDVVSNDLAGSRSPLALSKHSSSIFMVERALIRMCRRVKPHWRLSSFTEVYMLVGSVCVPEHMGTTHATTIGR